MAACVKARLHKIVCGNFHKQSFSAAVIVFGRMIWNYDAKTATIRNTVRNEIVVCLPQQKDFSTYLIIFLHIALKFDMEDFN
jgi:hypothetical protein